MSVKRNEGVKRGSAAKPLLWAKSEPPAKATQVGTVIQNWRFYERNPRGSQRYSKTLL